MKSVIREIMEKQGTSKTQLIHQTNLRKIDRILYGPPYKPTEAEYKLLVSMVEKPSCKVYYSNEPLITDFNGNRCINILSCLPSRSITGFNLYYKEINNVLHVWYQPKSRGKCIFTFKKYIELNESFISCLGLSVGDGLNNPSTRNSHYTFANTNFELVQLIFNWLKNNFNVYSANIQIYLNIPINQKTIPDTTTLEKQFSRKITVYKLKRHKNPSLTIQLGNRVFQCLYLSLLDKLKNTILNESSLRTAFLKGLFAAEGHVKHSVYNTIEGMSFAYNPKTEHNLMLFVKNCLAKEQIPSKDNAKGYLYFCGYENMIKFYQLGGLSLHEAKEKKFLQLVSNSKITLHFDKHYLDPLRLQSQRGLATKLKCSQPMLSKCLKRNFIGLQYLNKLGDLLDISLNIVNKQIKFVSVGSNIIRNPNAIKFLLSNLLKPGS